MAGPPGSTALVIISVCVARDKPLVLLALLHDYDTFWVGRAKGALIGLGLWKDSSRVCKKHFLFSVPQGNWLLLVVRLWPGSPKKTKQAPVSKIVLRTATCHGSGSGAVPEQGAPPYTFANDGSPLP